MPLTIRCELSAEPQYELGSPLPLAVRISADTDAYVLAWDTPLEERENAAFDVLVDGKEIGYDGVRVRRADPVLEDYVLVRAGEPVEVTVELARGYPIHRPGSYQVRVNTKMSHLAAAHTPVPQPREMHWPRTLISNWVTVSVVGDGESFATTGEQHRHTEPRVGAPEPRVSRDWEAQDPEFGPGITTEAEKEKIRAAHFGAYSLASTGLAIAQSDQLYFRIGTLSLGNICPDWP